MQRPSRMMVGHAEGGVPIWPKFNSLPHHPKRGADSQIAPLGRLLWERIDKSTIEGRSL